MNTLQVFLAIYYSMKNQFKKINKCYLATLNLGTFDAHRYYIFLNYGT